MLKLVLRKDKSQTAPFQRGLFPNSDPRSFLLVELPLRSGKEFLEIVENASPRLIVDLRDVPRFNFDILTRGKAFEAFAKVKSTYVDSDLPIELDGSRKNWNELFVRHKVLSALKEGRVLGPYMFLFSRDNEMPLFEQFLMKELPKSSGKSWSILRITSEEAFALKKFSK